MNKKASKILMNKKVSPEEIEEINKQLSKISIDPEMTILECHCFNLNFNDKVTKEEQCSICPIYMQFAAKYPKHCPDFS